MGYVRVCAYVKGLFVHMSVLGVPYSVGWGLGGLGLTRFEVVRIQKLGFRTQELEGIDFGFNNSNVAFVCGLWEFYVGCRFRVSSLINQVAGVRGRRL